MRILHVWDMGGVGNTLAKFMDRLYDTESMVVKRKAFDPYGITTQGELWDCGARMFYVRSLMRARAYDIVHVHALDKMVPILKLRYPAKPVILHYHGDDIRGIWEQRRKYWNKSDATVYSTVGLLDKTTPDHAVRVPNPVDTDLFHPTEEQPNIETAFHMSYSADDLASEIAQEFGLALTIHDRGIQGIIPHARLPEILRKYEYYIDVKRNYRGVLMKGGLSMTGLEALACGLKVINWEHTIVEGLPEEHLPQDVAKQVLGMYNKLLKHKT